MLGASGSEVANPKSSRSVGMAFEGGTLNGKLKLSNGSLPPVRNIVTGPSVLMPPWAYPTPFPAETNKPVANPSAAQFKFIPKRDAPTRQARPRQDGNDCDLGCGRFM